MTVTPEHFDRRSFVYPRLTAAGARFADAGDAAVASAYPDSPTPPLGLVDASPLARTGIKGPRALAWLAEAGWPVPDTNNRGVATDEGALVLRLGDREALVLPPLAGDTCAATPPSTASPSCAGWTCDRAPSPRGRSPRPPLPA